MGYMSIFPYKKILILRRKFEDVVIDTCRAVQRPVVSNPPDHIRPTRRSTDESEYMYWSDTVTVLRRTDYSVRVSGYTLKNPNNPTQPNIC